VSPVKERPYGWPVTATEERVYLRQSVTLENNCRCSPRPWFLTQAARNFPFIEEETCILFFSACHLRLNSGPETYEYAACSKRSKETGAVRGFFVHRGAAQRRSPPEL